MSLYPVGLKHFLILGTLLFCIGMYGALARRNAIGVLLSIELMLNGVNVLMVAFAAFVGNPQLITGQLFAVLIMTVAAAEAAIGLAIVIAVYRLRRSVAVNELD